jgi:hypothetical protein
VHGSLANRSARPRVGFVIRYATPDFTDPGTPVVLARGSLGSRRFTLADRPTETADTPAEFERANLQWA